MCTVVYDRTGGQLRNDCWSNGPPRRLLLWLVLFMALATTGGAQTVGGTCGENVRWRVSAQHDTLFFTGSGAMEDYENVHPAWYDYCQIVKSIVIGDSITVIGEQSFTNFKALESVQIGASVREIGFSAFFGVSLRSIVFPEGLTTLRSAAFEFSMLDSVSFPASIRTIGNRAFLDCSNLKVIHIPDSAVFIGAYAFVNTGYFMDWDSWTEEAFYIGHHLCNVQPSATGAVTVREGTKTIASRAFSNCSQLSAILLPKSLTRICSGAFSLCNGLDSIVLPEGVTRAEYALFEECSGLKRVTFGHQIDSMESDVFSFCNALEHIIMPVRRPPSVHGWTFGNMSENCTIAIPCGAMEAYENAPYWKTAGILKEDCNGEIDVYPNPVTDWLNIETMSTGQVEVFDAAGRKIHEAVIPGQINTSAWPRGCYALHLRIKDGTVMEKITKY